MNIVHINSYYYASHFYKHLYDIQEINNNISVFVPVNVNYKEKKFVFGKYTKIIPVFKNIDRYFFFIKQRKIYNTFVELYKNKNIDIIHAHSLFTNGYTAFKYNIKYNISYIVAVRNTDINVFFKLFKYTGIKILLRAKKIILISPAYISKLLKFIPLNIKQSIIEKIIVIPNGIDNFWIDNINDNKKQITKEIKLVYCGNINKNKNLLNVAKAIKFLKKENFLITYDVIGNIKNRGIFNKLSKYDFFNYIGYKNAKEIMKIYKKENIFIMVSYHETFGLSYIEALSQGLPIIYTKDEGIDGYFNDNFVGYATSPKNYIEISQAIKNTIINYNEICFKSTFNINFFCWDNLSLKYDKIYKEIMENEKSIK